MANSKAQIFNIALNILGVSNPLENANCNDNRAILLNNYYKMARDYVLKDFDWNFASTYRELSLVNVPYEDNMSRYEFVFDYPNDCLFARDIFEKGCFKLTDFGISSREDGSLVILSHCKNAILRYTRRVEKEIYFSPEFSMALAYYLASLTSNVITGSIQKGELAYQKYTKILKHAKAINASESIEEIYNTDTYLEARN